MTLTIKKNGQNLVNFTEASVSRSIENVCGSFTFSSTTDQNNLFPVKIGDQIQILADDKLILTSFAETLSTSYDSGSHGIIIGGRGILCDFIDSTVSNSIEFTGSVSLKTIAETLLADIGIKVKVIDGTGGTIKDFDSFDVESIGIGQKAFDFLESYARKRQVLINSDEFGNLVLTRASDLIFNARLKNIIDGIDNNVLSAELNIDQTKIYNTYITHSQLNPLIQDDSVNISDIVSQISSPAVNSSMRDTRQLIFNAEESSDGLTVNERAIWEANIRRAQSLNYSAKVQGHTVNGVLWTYNNLIQIDDDFAGIHGKMFIKSVKYGQALSPEGSTTSLGVTFKDAYTLQAEQSAREANTSDQGSGWF